MPNATPPGSDAGQSPAGSAALWLWSGPGFLIAFLGLAVVYPVYFCNGNSLRQTVLWKYYVLEIQLAMETSGMLGPTSGNAAAALMAAGMHVAISGRRWNRRYGNWVGRTEKVVWRVTKQKQLASSFHSREWPQHSKCDCGGWQRHRDRARLLGQESRQSA